MSDAPAAVVTGGTRGIGLTGRSQRLVVEEITFV